MEELISFQNNLLAQLSNNKFRYLYHHLKTDERLLGIKGLRGTGKTTLLLQYLAYAYPNREKGLYVTADHPYFYTESLFGLASQWHSYGGELLLIDEVHKYPNWSRELKLIYDGFPKMQVLFTSSSALDLYRGESDLSRRLVTQFLHGMSFREFLNMKYDYNFDVLKLEDILKNHSKTARQITSEIKVLPLFKEYLKSGYFPFANSGNPSDFSIKLLQVINTVLETDLAFAQDYSVSNIEKIKKLLGVISVSAPFEPNVSSIAQKLQIGRNTVTSFLYHLEDAHILSLANKPNKGISHLQKPDKIYFENTNFAYSFQQSPEIGSIRETFFFNQLRNAGHRVNLSLTGDFLVDETQTFEVGGKNKTQKQITNTPNAYIAMDETEAGIGNRIPLWIFGFLY